VGDKLTPSNNPAMKPYRRTKKHRIALLLETLLGLFGFLGIGWIYSGNKDKGIQWFVGMLAWDIFAAPILVFTIGLGCIFTFPVNLILTAISVVSLDRYLKEYPISMVEN
jgi:hypothetical protein